MKFEIKNTRHGEPIAKFFYTNNDVIGHGFEIEPGLMDVKDILKLIAYLVEYLKGIL